MAQHFFFVYLTSGKKKNRDGEVIQELAKNFVIIIKLYKITAQNYFTIAEQPVMFIYIYTCTQKGRVWSCERSCDVWNRH